MHSLSGSLFKYRPGLNRHLLVNLGLLVVSTELMWLGLLVVSTELMWLGLLHCLKLKNKNTFLLAKKCVTIVIFVDDL